MKAWGLAPRPSAVDLSFPTGRRVAMSSSENVGRNGERRYSIPRAAGAGWVQPRRLERGLGWGPKPFEEAGELFSRWNEPGRVRARLVRGDRVRALRERYAGSEAGAPLYRSPAPGCGSSS